MAKLTEPLGSSEARGKVAGYCYNTWRGISYVKTITAPGNQNTARRLAVRALAKQCTTRWQTITDVQRGWWNHYATVHLDPYWTGNDKRISGYCWFLRANFRLLDIGLSIIDTPPTRANLWPLATLAASVISDEITITWTLPPGATGTQLTTDIYYTKPLSAGRRPKLEDAKHKAYVAAQAGTYTTPALAAGHYGIFARTIDELTGLASPWLLVEATIAPGAPETAGPNPPTLADTTGARPFPWSNPTRIFIQDDEWATCVLFPGEQSDDLLARHFDFAIPLTATITGIKVELWTLNDEESDFLVQLYLVPLPKGVAKLEHFAETEDAWHALGGPADLWGFAWTPADINADGFGLTFSTTNGEGSPSTWWVDALQITVYYTT